MTAANSIRQEISSLLQGYAEAHEFVHKLSELGELLFFGGAIRDYYINKSYASMPRDFDIAINLNADQDEISFSLWLSAYTHRKNRFGGYKLVIENLEFDIWEMKNTWAFKEQLLPAAEENLVKTVYLNIDAVAYNFNKDILYKDDFMKSIEEKTIDIVLEHNPHTTLNLLRAMMFRQKYGMGYSNRLKSAFLDHIHANQEFDTELYRVQLSHYKRECIGLHQIREELTNLTHT